MCLCLRSSPGTLAKNAGSSYQMTHFNSTKKEASGISGGRRGTSRVGGERKRFSPHPLCVFFSCRSVHSFFLLFCAQRFNSAREEAKLPAPLLFHHHQYYLRGARTLFPYLCFIIAQRNSLRLPSIIFFLPPCVQFPFQFVCTKKAPPLYREHHQMR
jgi:hypothetical protein